MILEKFAFFFAFKEDFTLGGISALRLTISEGHRSDLAYQV